MWGILFCFGIKLDNFHCSREFFSKSYLQLICQILRTYHYSILPLFLAQKFGCLISKLFVLNRGENFTILETPIETYIAIFYLITLCSIFSIWIWLLVQGLDIVGIPVCGPSKQPLSKRYWKKMIEYFSRSVMTQGPPQTRIQIQTLHRSGGNGYHNSIFGPSYERAIC